MKHYITLIFFAFSFVATSQNILISELADPDDDSSCRFVEIFCHGPNPCDLSNLSLARWTNASATPTISTLVPLSVLGTLQPNEIAVISNNSSPNGTFLSCYGFNANITAGSGGPADSNGDDQIGIVDGSLTIIDIFGVPGEDGTGTCHEFEDGRAERKSSVTLSNPVFNEAEWNVWSDNGPAGSCTSHIATPQNVSDMDPLSSILPVELVDLRIQKSLSSNRLTWKTLSEINNAYFEIQLSADGRNFQSIGKVEGNGNSNRALDYQYIHENPNAGLNYYRLKQVDLDGVFEYSYIVKVENKSNRIKVYPTSTSNTINVEIEDTESTKLTLVNNSGQTFKVVNLTSTFNTIDISDLPAGVYYARIESNTQFLVERIMKN